MADIFDFSSISHPNSTSAAVCLSKKNVSDAAATLLFLKHLVFDKCLTKAFC